jgi:Holliday junction resolvase-like predicted endonuclease
MENKMKTFHVGISAEAFAAALFAHAGYDVLVQYGANQPEYDLTVASDNDQLLKISVKGSQDGGWGLTQNYKKGRNYHQAADEWSKKHSKNIIFCLVQFENVKLGKCPRVYIASVSEVTAFLKKARNGEGDTVLRENHLYKSGIAKGYSDIIPKKWKLSKTRISELIKQYSISK